MKMTLGYQGFMGQFLFNGGMKMLFEMFCYVWLVACSPLLAFLFCFPMLVLGVHTCGYTHRIIPQGLSPIVSWQELKKE